MKTLVVKFESFGLHNPTTISFSEELSDKMSKISFTQCDINIISSAIKGIVNSNGIDKAFYITSSRLFNAIQQRTLTNSKSVYELFKENGVKIEEVEEV